MMTNEQKLIQLIYLFRGMLPNTNMLTICFMAIVFSLLQTTYFSTKIHQGNN